MLSRFPDFPKLRSAEALGDITLRAGSSQDPDQITIKCLGSTCEVVIYPACDTTYYEEGAETPQELEALRRAKDTAPNPVWQEDQSGHLLWFNTAYAALPTRLSGALCDGRTPVFDKDGKTAKTRVQLQATPGGKPDWYEVSRVEQNDIAVFHAICINAVVEAEEAQRTFVQTLAKTFAHLSIGLAIFNREGQLSMFNPALVDLSGLPARYLSGQPTMLSFFDQLREARRMPEPKNYRSWRQEITDLIAAASDGLYEETWSLESGQTYSVQGRPHPDGTTAFLFEDISAEMALTRNFRAELERAQALIDAVDDAMAIFSPSGVLSFCNATYSAYWKIDPDSAFADVTLEDCLVDWRAHGMTAKQGLRVSDFVLQNGPRDTFTTTVRLADGDALQCTLRQIATGATLVRFHGIRTTARHQQSEPAQGV